MAKKLGWKSKTLIGLLGLVVAGLVGGELFARFYLGLGDPPLSIADPQLEYYFKPGTYHRFGHTIHYNAYSMRSADITPHKTDPRELRVLVLGDSVLNGGVETDDSQTMTSLLQADLTKKLGRPVFVGNISAGSWGPPNETAYLKKFGTFDADAIVLEVSGHDGADAPTFEPVVDVVPSMPGTKPISALYEGFTRYLLPRFESAPPPPPPDPSVPDGAKPLDNMAQRRAECREAIIEMADMCAARHIPFEIELFWARYEIEKEPDPNQNVLLDAAHERKITLVSLDQAIRNANSPGKPSFYRDDFHPNQLGDRIAAEVMEPSIIAMLTGAAATRPAAQAAP